MSTGESLPAAYFDALYAKENDPWCFATSPYEKAKDVATLQALPVARFTNAFEIGCSIGVLTSPAGATLRPAPRSRCGGRGVSAGTAALLRSQPCDVGAVTSAGPMAEAELRYDPVFRSALLPLTR